MTYQNKKAGQHEPAAAPANSERRWDASRTNSAAPQTSAWRRQLAAELATELPLKFEPDLLSVLKLHTGGNWIV